MTRDLIDLAHAGGNIERDRERSRIPCPLRSSSPTPTPNHMIMTGKKMIFGVGPEIVKIRLERPEAMICWLQWTSPATISANAANQSADGDLIDR